jgi:hypothetical protein
MTIPAAAYLQICADADAGKIKGQVQKPSYWIEVTQGSAWFAVQLWDGMGYPEPWETGIGRYATKEEAIVEAKQWAEAVGLEYRA